MKFKPTKKKIIFSITTIIIWYILIVIFTQESHCLCTPCQIEKDIPNCQEVFILDILPEVCGCNCGCPQSTPIKEIISDLTILLLPGILVYLIFSLKEK